jgi:hypothetical protein
MSAFATPGRTFIGGGNPSIIFDESDEGVMEQAPRNVTPATIAAGSKTSGGTSTTTGMFRIHIQHSL